MDITGKDEMKFSAVLQIYPASRKIGFSDFKQIRNCETGKFGKQKARCQAKSQLIFLTLSNDLCIRDGKNFKKFFLSFE